MEGLVAAPAYTGAAHKGRAVLDMGIAGPWGGMDRGLEERHRDMALGEVDRGRGQRGTGEAGRGRGKHKAEGMGFALASGVADIAADRPAVALAAPVQGH